MARVLHLRPRVRVHRVHRVLIEHETFGTAIDVRVSPSPDGVGHDRSFPNQAAAVRYAASLGAAMGWEVVDLVGGDEAA